MCCNQNSPYFKTSLPKRLHVQEASRKGSFLKMRPFDWPKILLQILSDNQLKISAQEGFVRKAFLISTDSVDLRLIESTHSRKMFQASRKVSNDHQECLRSNFFLKKKSKNLFTAANSAMLVPRLIIILNKN